MSTVRKAARSVAAATLCFCGAGLRADASTVPAGFVEERVADGLVNPTAMALAPDGRIFVCEQGGSLRVAKGGALLPTPLLSVAVDSAGERGLLGVAVDPAFATNQYLYIYYTVAASPVHNRVSRFTASGDVALPGSEVVLLELENLSSATNHNGGGLHFGLDGKLYVAVGDNANGANAQTLSNRLGKILRLNADGSIPPDNPFYSQATGANRAIWALGLRNPFTFAFHRTTGRVFINDVGASAWEEINDGQAGANYGWPSAEGPAGPSPNPAFAYPLFAYAHGTGATTGCAITGGAFYDSASTFPPEYLGKYFFADLCSGWIRRLDPAVGTATTFASGIPQPVDMFVSPGGDLFYLARGSGEVFRISYSQRPGQRARYRLYSDITKEHLYTTDTNEYTVLSARGWVPEGIGHWVPIDATPIGGVSPVPLYRLYHAGIRQHLWTLDANEYGVLATRGWTQEGTDALVLPTAVSGVTVPLYRLAYAFLPLHLWTTDANEYAVLPSLGWIQEGVAAHVLP